MATPFKLKSSGPFKMMGSSPARQKKRNLDNIKKFFKILVHQLMFPEFFKSVDTKLKSVGDNVEKFKGKEGLMT
jgi:hypothetical protein